MIYAFSLAFTGADQRYPALAALVANVAARPNVARYLVSERRISFNESGVFRHCPELDHAAAKADPTRA
jgi:glutathione S-transferase